MLSIPYANILKVRNKYHFFYRFFLLYEPMKRFFWVVLFGLCLLPNVCLQAAGDVVHVEVKGVGGKARENVLALLEIYRERNEETLTPARIELLFKKGYQDIKKALEPFGYFSPHIVGKLTRKNATEAWCVFYKIDKGPPATIERINIEIDGPGRVELSSLSFPMKKGERFKQEKYEKFKRELIDKAKGLGYLDGSFMIHQVLVDKVHHTVAISLHFQTGQRYKFGKLHFNKTTLSEDFLKRYAKFRPGDPFDAGKLAKFRSRLLDSDYFRDVTIEYSKDKTNVDNMVPLTVTCPMKRANVFRLGLGYVSDIGPRVSLEWRRRYLGSKGHHLKTRFRFSPDETLMSGEYFIPLGRPYSDYFSVKPFIEHYDTDSRNGWKYNVSLMYSKVIKGGWRQNAGINFGYENYETGGEKNDSKELIPFISWYKSEADNILYATRGYSVKFGLSGEMGGLFANKSYLSSLLNTKFIRRFATDYRFITRLDLGAIATSDVEEIPSSSRFYAGGQNSIRGFSLEELGPKNPETGEVTGGRYLAVCSVELERQIYKLLSGAIFVDAGNSFDPDFTNKIEIGAGFGLRFRTVLGPVRLDFGFGVSRKSIPFKFYLSVGPDF